MNHDRHYIVTLHGEMGTLKKKETQKLIKVPGSLNGDPLGHSAFDNSKFLFLIAILGPSLPNS